MSDNSLKLSILIILLISCLDISMAINDQNVTRDLKSSDADGDGLNDTEETWWACSPTKIDTDDDGYTDGDEIHLPIDDPNKGDGCPYTEDSLRGKDNDRDGLPVGAEINVNKTNPNSYSSDGDRYSDGMEVLGFDFYDKERMPDYVDREPLIPATADVVLEMDPKVQLNLAKKVKKESKILDSVEKAYNAERGFKEAATLKTVVGGSVSSEASAGFPPWGTKAQVKSEVHFNTDLELEGGFSASQTWASKREELREISEIEEIDLSGSTLQIWINVKNIGNDIVNEGIKELKLNLYIGNDKEPFEIIPLNDIGGENLKPGDDFKITIKDIPINYERFKRLMSGEGVRVGIAHYSFGEDQKYLNNAKARCVEINIDDGTGLIKLRVAPSARKITLHDALNLSKISVAFENGTIKSVNGRETKSGSPPYMWWNFIIIRQQLKENKSPNIKDRNQSDNILDSDTYPGDIVFLKYQMDSDGDLLPDTEERIIGTRADKLDTDEDGLWDGDSISDLNVTGERKNGTNPLLKDTDDDGLDDSIDPKPLDAPHVVPDPEPYPVLLYDHRDYKGIAGEFWDDSPNLGELDNKVQSLKVPWGCQVELFGNANYNGTGKVFTNDTPWVGDDFFDNAASIKIKRIVLFDHTNYRGKSKTIMQSDIPYIGQQFDDMVESLTVPQGYSVTLYENRNFTGKNETYSADKDWLGIELHDKVSSIKIRDSPKNGTMMSAEKGGSILVRCEGGYVARFTLSYKLKGTDIIEHSGDITLGIAKSKDIPAGATDIHLKVEEMWGFGWSTIFAQNYGEPVTKCFKVYGTTLSPKYKEISC